MEGTIADAEGKALVGMQSKFFDEKFDSTQWRGLDQSIHTALADNVGDFGLREIVVTLPRTLTQRQAEKWTSKCANWAAESKRLGYTHDITFTLWDESRFRDLLLKAENRGLLLHFFEFPDFDIAHCRERTRVAIVNLGNRYQPELHTATEAEGKLHTFLRSERCRQEYLETARDNLRDRWRIEERPNEWPAELGMAYDKAEAAWEQMLLLLGDGVSLPDSFSALSQSCAATAAALDPVEEGIAEMIPPRKPRPGEEYGYPYPRSSNEEMQHDIERWSRALRSFFSYLRAQSLAEESCLLFTGEPGTGKTHVLAEVCSRYNAQGGVILFVEGAAFTSKEPVWLQFMKWVGHSGENFRDFLEILVAMAEATKIPALICIDAVNETPCRNLWKSGLAVLARDVRAVPGVKLVVSCRSDYLKQTLPSSIAEQSADGWAFAEHEGLGVEVYEAFPKYIKAYKVRWNGLPPLCSEFQNPLLLRTFCEAYTEQTPEPGSLSLAAILRAFVARKSQIVGCRIDCDPSQVLEALRNLAEAMGENGLQIPERTARGICEKQHAPTESSRSLYRALLHEGVLDEFPAFEDELGSSNLVRFTYERVWDYFVSLRLLPKGTRPSVALLAQLRNPDWRAENSGVVSLLITRWAEEGLGELVDLIFPEGPIDFDVMEAFYDSLPWRTRQSVSARTLELFEAAKNWWGSDRELDYLVPLAPNPEHPWNADWLHERLRQIPLAERDRTWTFWVNEQLHYTDGNSPLREQNAPLWGTYRTSIYFSWQLCFLGVQAPP